MQNIYFVIQGLVSSPGSNFFLKDVYYDFDSTPVILNNIRKLINKKVGVIYSGWFRDCTPSLKEDIEQLGAKVVLSDPEKIPIFEPPDKDKRVKNNETKQYMSSFSGIEAIKHDLADTIVVKMRSDMELDFDLFFSEIEKYEKKIRSGSILVNYLSYRNSSEIPDVWTPDFFFVGRGDVMHSIFKDLLNRSLRNDSYSKVAHSDFARAILAHHWKYLPVKRKQIFSIRMLLTDTIKNFKISNIALIFGEIKRRKNAALVKKKMTELVRENLIIPTSRPLAHSMVWRGHSYGDFVKKNPRAEKDRKYS